MNSNEVLNSSERISPSFSLMQRLQAMQSQARSLLVLYGIAFVTSLAILSFTFLMMLDFFFWFPAILRILLTITWIAIACWLVHANIWKPMMHPMHTLHLAAKVEERYADFHDRLTSAVSFILEGTPDRFPLRQKMLERTEVIARSVPIEKAISTHPTWRMVGLCVLVLLIGSGMVWINPAWFSIGSQRLLLPFSSLAWPKTVLIEPLSTDLVIAKGEPAILSLNISRGSHDALRAYLYTRRLDGLIEKAVMRREGPTRYAWTLASASENSQYWFEAGDDSTRERPYHIRVVDRPKVFDAQVSIYPPPYVSTQKPKTYSAGQKNIDIIEGGSLVWNFKSSKPVQLDAQQQPQVWILDSTESRVFAEPSETIANDYTARLSPSQDEYYRIRIIDTDGFENFMEDTLSANVRKDDPPSISITQPIEVLEVTPQATITITATARDDLGIDAIRLVTHVPSGQSSDQLLRDWTASIDEHQNSITARLIYAWNLKPLQLAVGDTVQYHLRVLDNRLTTELAPQESRSNNLLLKVVSESQLTAGVAEEINTLAKKLRRALQTQQRLRDETESLQLDQDKKAPSDMDRQLLRLSDEQRSVANMIEGIQKNVSELAEHLRNNNVLAGQEKQQADLLIAELKGQVEPSMNQAAVLLNSARAQPSQDQQTARIQNAGLEQLQAIQALQKLLNQLTTWDDYQSAITSLREIGDLQQQVASQTAELQEKTPGQNLENLPDDVRQELQENAHQQDQVSAALDRALVELNNRQQKLQETKPDDAKNLAEMRQKLEQARTPQLSRSAANAIRENKTGQAQEDQSQIEQAITQALTQLQEKQTKQLAELAKKINKIEEVLQSIIDQQQKLRNDTREIPEDQVADRLPELAKRQRQLRTNTLAIIDQINQIPEATQAGEQIRQAAQTMEQATDALYKPDSPGTIDAQNRTLQLLQQALALLQELRKKNEENLQKEQFLALQRTLIDIHKKQSAINSQTQTLIRQRQETGKMTRKETRESRKLARAQSNLLALLAPIQEKLTDTPVYLWVITRITDEMTISQQRLEETLLEAPLERTQQRILALLDQLIGAMKEAQSLAEQEFADGATAGQSGQGQSAQQRPVPPVAELLVLKSMQQDILTRTSDLHQTTQNQTLNEQQLLEIQSLVQDQGMLQKLTAELTQKARQQQ